MCGAGAPHGPQAGREGQIDLIYLIFFLKALIFIGIIYMEYRKFSGTYWQLFLLLEGALLNKFENQCVYMGLTCLFTQFEVQNVGKMIYLCRDVVPNEWGGAPSWSTQLFEADGEGQINFKYLVFFLKALIWSCIIYMQCIDNCPIH